MYQTEKVDKVDFSIYSTSVRKACPRRKFMTTIKIPGDKYPSFSTVKKWAECRRKGERGGL